MLDRESEVERLRFDIREYIIDMLSQLAAMAETCREMEIAEMIRKVVAAAPDRVRTSG